MRYAFTTEEEEFRGEVRDWLGTQLPDEWNGINEDSEEGWRFTLDMRRKLADKGWLTLAWPAEYGGAGASFMKQVVFNEEMAYARCPGIDGSAIKMLGPTLMIHGSEEQRRTLLPPVARGEVEWCQGYSEPDSRVPTWRRCSSGLTRPTTAGW
ncbi:MAG: acyl-CoA dehydrogenase family protein [Chloroflexi bacterium]|nr:acyl-CoA dehydrogenase family protein [Chloroflexota bacterium]